MGATWRFVLRGVFGMRAGLVLAAFSFMPQRIERSYRGSIALGAGSRLAGREQFTAGVALSAFCESF